MLTSANDIAPMRMIVTEIRYGVTVRACIRYHSPVKAPRKQPRAPHGIGIAPIG